MTALFDPIPLPWIVFGALGSLAFAVHALERVTALHERSTAAGKLGYFGCIVEPRIRRSEDGKAEGLEWVTLGVEWASSADFAMEFEVLKMDVSFSNALPANRILDGARLEVPPRGSGYFRATSIKLDRVFDDLTPEGEIEYEIRYGRKGGKLRHIDKQRLAVRMGRNPQSGQIGFTIEQAHLGAA